MFLVVSLIPAPKSAIKAALGPRHDKMPFCTAPAHRFGAMAPGVLLVAIGPNLRGSKPAELSVAALVIATSLDVCPGGTSKRQGRHLEPRHIRSAQPHATPRAATAPQAPPSTPHPGKQTPKSCLVSLPCTPAPCVGRQVIMSAQRAAMAKISTNQHSTPRRSLCCDCPSRTAIDATTAGTNATELPGPYQARGHCYWADRHP